MQSAHDFPLYETLGSRAHMAEEMAKLALIHQCQLSVPSESAHLIGRERFMKGRNRFTRTVDALLSVIRQYLPSLHWLLVRSIAFLLFCYVRAGLRSTVALLKLGHFQWPEIPKGSVLAIWHGSIPSLLTALVVQRPTGPVHILVARDSRGDSLALLCRWLGFEVIRGDSEHGGWEALAQIAENVHKGAAALITVDGGGPALNAKVGAVALASVAHAPLIPIGADCRPAVLERHKWDAPRNPLPYARIAVVCGEPISFQAIADATALEVARRQLQEALNSVSRAARRCLTVASNEAGVVRPDGTQRKING